MHITLCIKQEVTFVMQLIVDIPTHSLVKDTSETIFYKCWTGQTACFLFFLFLGLQ